jgi:hypothetical protein
VEVQVERMLLEHRRYQRRVLFGGRQRQRGLRGREQGEQTALVRLFEKRLGRPLDEGEKATVLQMLGSLG